MKIRIGKNFSDWFFGRPQACPEICLIVASSFSASPCEGVSDMHTNDASAAKSTARLSGRGGRIGADAESILEAAGTREFVSFAIGDDQYGVDIMAVREIKEWSNITRLPKQPDYVRGVLNLRGVMVPIIDLRCRFGQGRTETTPLHIVVIVQIDERLVGLLVDRVLDIVAFEAGKIQAVPKVVQSSLTGFLAGLVTSDGNLIALIDLPSLLAMPAV